jgi:hypothetical protein
VRLERRGATARTCSRRALRGPGACGDAGCGGAGPAGQGGDGACVLPERGGWVDWDCLEGGAAAVEECCREWDADAMR